MKHEWQTATFSYGDRWGLQLHLIHDDGRKQRKSVRSTQRLTRYAARPIFEAWLEKVAPDLDRDAIMADFPEPE